MAKYIIMVLASIISLNAMTLMTLEEKNKAQNILIVEIEDVSTMWGVTLEAMIVEVIKSNKKLKPENTIKIKYDKPKDKGEFYLGTPDLWIPHKGEKLKVYLNNNGSVFHPAFGFHSFDLVEELEF